MANKYDNLAQGAVDTINRIENSVDIDPEDITEKLEEIEEALVNGGKRAAGKLAGVYDQLLAAQARYIHQTQNAQIQQQRELALAAAEGDEAQIKRVNKKFALEAKLEKKRNTAQEKYDKKKEKQIKRAGAETDKKQRLGNSLAAIERGGIGGLAAGLSKAFSKTYQDEAGNTITKGRGERLSDVVSALSSFAGQFKGTVEEIASQKGAIDTRLQGSKGATSGGSYWDSMNKSLTSIAGVSPLVKQEEIAKNISALVGQGISFNVEQRAVLATMKDKIATTFDATNATLTRLVRIQQEDTTAGRLGMESALTSFLNNMYETTEYMQGIAASVKGSLEESMALMTGKSAVAFEYQVQKWLGSMYSTGMQQSSVQNIAGVLGDLAAGKISSITGGGAGNLAVMAANQAGLNIADVLADGLDESSTNQLMEAMVEYLAKIYNQAGDSKVVQQQIASVYGLSASDLKAMVSLAKSSSTVAQDGLSYNDAINQLNSMANSMYKRTSIGEMASNLMSNIQYGLAANIAGNPALYATYSAANMLDSLAGGMDIATGTVAGTGITSGLGSVASLMKAGALGGGIISSIGQLVSGISKGGNGGITGSGILRAAGINGSNTTMVTRGTGQGLRTTGGITTSESGGVAGNASDSDVSNATIASRMDEANSTVGALKEESTEATLTNVNDNVKLIYDVLSAISSGTTTLNVNITNDRIRTESTF